MEVVPHIVKFNSQTSGRDKLCRLFQYAAKLASYHSALHGSDLSKKFKILENNLSATRKVLRIGKSLDMVQGALKNLSEEDVVVRTCLVVAKMNQAIYLLVDHYIWMAKTGLVQANTKRLGKLAAKFWLITLVANLVRNIYDIRCVILREQKKAADSAKRSTGDYAVESNGTSASWQPVGRSPSLLHAVLRHRPVVVDTVKNTADLFLPLSSLEYVNFSDGILGILGMISSYMGVLATWNPANKLVP